MKYIENKNGLKIAYLDLAPENTKTILFIHGWPLDSRIFEYQLNVLPRYGFRCIAIDLKGYGQSDKPYDGYDYDSMASDVYDLVEKLNLNDFTLVGFSMGGAIASRYMANYEGKGVNKLALISAAVPRFSKNANNPYGMDFNDIDNLLVNLYKDRPKALNNFGTNFFAKSISPDFRMWFNNLCNSESSYGTIHSLIALRNEDCTKDLIQIKVPTAIFHGKLDKICRYELALHSHKLISNSKLYSYDSSGHGLFYDDLEKFNKDFVDFLNL